MRDPPYVYAVSLCRDAEGFAGAWSSATIVRAPGDAGLNGDLIVVQYGEARAACARSRVADQKDFFRACLNYIVLLLFRCWTPTARCLTKRCCSHGALPLVSLNCRAFSLLSSIIACSLRPEQPADTWRVTTLDVGLAVDVYFNEVWWQGYLRCQPPATAVSAGEWLVYCPETNDEVVVDVAAWEAELDAAPAVDGAIRAGLSWRDGIWYRRACEDDQSMFSDSSDNEFPMMPRRPVRRQLVPDSSLDGVSVSKGDPAARPLMTPSALEALSLPLERLQAILEARGNDVCKIIPGAFVRSFTDQDSVLASRLWIVASASVHSSAGGLASIELCDAESGDVILASALCNAAPTGLDVAALMASASFLS